MTQHEGGCFHCGEPLPGRAAFEARVHGRVELVCCAGCRAVAELIADAGLQDFYRFRTAPSLRPAPPESVDDWERFDQPDICASVATVTAGGLNSVTLAIDGVRCAACGWLIDRMLSDLRGVEKVSINPATARARVDWQPGTTGLAAILRTIASLGYRPHPIGTATGAGSAYGHVEAERRAALKRLAVAGLGMMQVMTYAVSMYAGAGAGMEPEIALFLRVVSLLVCTPVLLYSGRPFFAAAWRSLRARSIGMDVPVSTALALAWGASVFNTLRGAGEVYFDSVTMFVFFLTLARYVEMVARHRSTGLSEALARIAPATARRCIGVQLEDVPIERVAVHDELLIRAGETIPADGIVVAGEARCDESLLTGEAVPVVRRAGEPVVAGSVNAGGPVRIRVTATGPATALAGIVALLERTQAARPQLARRADRAASWFLARVLIAASLVCVAWLVIDPSRAFETTLAVLVVTCPCALSLATPAAMAAATARLARHGALVCSPDAIEHLARVRHVVFDKTGTLTAGRMTVVACEPLGSLSANECLRIAAGLEAHSAHPIGRAFAGLEAAPARDVVVNDGRGMEGWIDGRRYRIGSRTFITSADPAEGDPDDARILLADDRGPVPSIELGDALRAEAPHALAELRRCDLELAILSGDAECAVRETAQACGIAEFHARCPPEGKVRLLAERARRGELVAMVGDGINDAPGLKAAHVAIAMGHGSALAHSSADVVLPGDSLAALAPAIRLAQRTVRVVRQNLAWAVVYNLTALPLAACGLVPPWLAAIGMSTSSVLVVLNALRLAATPTRRRSRTGPLGLSPVAGIS